ncbi:6,7-dimethyl-8-ribityllumazine synthase [Devosia sp. Root436]|uniref:6,7-dimethyl-8-ribityllumazine synthase n=1 Tax=Devosia sp. Root436 TaxID=1736537 RepID=UPI000700CCD3|nr:6,7-dimethyl-8-ribityllumazine synthase [Devosia sp. Root436]KQX33994.1 6,7-dimethyl-8-ribityllumazine synthase [Devosia sp. Root436]
MSDTSPRLAIVVSQFNPEVTHGLRDGALKYLSRKGIPIAPDNIYSAPGAFEIPLIAKRLAQSGFDGVICLGCVIKGDTAHFEYISEAAAHGLMQAGLETGKPITFGILTTYTDEQAIVRSRDDEHNKGREAAAACLKVLRIFSTLGS